ncbi:Methionine--tRNA ligase, cytoplasmic [Halotydeus destructor]|nr:Methionine--tRNA ligase, cytoplasmic [Halotydeus destructor]
MEPTTASSIDELEEAFRQWSVAVEPKKPSSEKVLPVIDGKSENIIVTSALPYVNNVPHLGNIIGSVLSADVYARYCRLRGKNTIYICGTDEYGTATETKAIEEGLTPKQICDKYHKIHSDIYQWFNIKFDLFGRTTTDNQTKISQDIFWKLYNNGFILEDSVDQLHCSSCERFLADRFVEGTCPLCKYDDARGDQCDKCGKLINAPDLINPRCKLCSKAPALKSSKHLFLDLPKLQPEIEIWFKSVTEAEDSSWSQTGRVITAAWLKDGLKPRCITRDLKWGTPVPLKGYEDKVFYVWFDAPIGYLSMTNTYTEDWEKWWKNPENVSSHQFMAKDNVPFHAIIMPGSQLGARDNYTVVKHLHAVEYLNYEDAKFSKSRGIGVFGNDAKETGIPADIWRFYLLYIRPESQDSNFSWVDLMTKNNSELLNNVGNFINRALMFVYNNFEGVIPEIVLNEDDKRLVADINKEVKKYIELLDKAKERDGLRQLLNISRLGNQHIQATKPWELVKAGDEESKKRAGSILGLATNVSALLSLLLSPYIPEVCETLKQQLNFDGIVYDSDCFRQLLPAGHRINKPSPLFRKIDAKEIDDLKVRFAGKQSQPDNGTKQQSKEELPLDSLSGDAGELLKLINEQGDKIRSLKSTEGTAKDVITCQVNVLKTLKERYAQVTGTPLETPNNKKKGKK